MAYNIIVENSELDLEVAINKWIENRKKDNPLVKIDFIGGPIQVQHGPELFRIAQAFTDNA